MGRYGKKKTWNGIKNKIGTIKPKKKIHNIKSY